MTTPQRIQLSRARGWRMPANAVKVDRSTKWGNPFRITEERNTAMAVSAFRTWLTVDGCHANMPERKRQILESLHELRGKDLACWCNPCELCHADVLLELANKDMTDQYTVCRRFADMAWPCPGERMNEIEWQLRYGEPSRQELLSAASTIAAYRELVTMPERRRRKVIPELRAGANIRRQ